MMKNKNEKKFKHAENNEDNSFAKVKNFKKDGNLKQLKKKRLIVRNLSFKVTEKELKRIFSEFGDVLDVKIPLNEAGKKRGFAFVQFNNSKFMIKAMEKLNFKEIYGRPIAIDISLDKRSYLSLSKNSYSDPKKKRISKGEKQGHTGISKGEKKGHTGDYSDVLEGKTVFIENISFRNTEQDVLKILEEYGETQYCLFCNDPATGRFKGTAFVKFKEKESAEKFIKESSKEPGILLAGRKLLCRSAISREELSKRRDCSEKHKDRRNLRLLKYGLVTYGSKESDGVSQTDMAKRAQLEAVKNQKLRNVNFFVSDKRLVCHNIPKNINDKDLYHLFKKAGGEGAIVKEARIMRDFKKVDAMGNPLSRGFAFVAFTEHEHALKALQELNNNPTIFTANKRPIVEFSVENKVALLSQKRKREKIKMQNKKRIELNNNQNSQVNMDQHSSEIKIRL